jgi:hypothetical protein
VSARAKQAAVASGCPYLLAKLKAPRVLERLEQTAERARAEQWPYEQFLEALLEAEVFARDASGARQHIRHVMNADGTGKRLVIPSGYAAVWSPDGERIAFGRRDRLYIADADGGDVRLLWSRPGVFASLSWQPRH